MPPPGSGPLTPARVSRCSRQGLRLASARLSSFILPDPPIQHVPHRLHHPQRPPQRPKLRQRLPSARCLAGPLSRPSAHTVEGRRPVGSTTFRFNMCQSQPHTPPWREQQPRPPPHPHDGERVPSQHFARPLPPLGLMTGPGLAVGGFTWTGGGFDGEGAGRGGGRGASCRGGAARTEVVCGAAAGRWEAGVLEWRSGVAAAMQTTQPPNAVTRSPASVSSAIAAPLIPRRCGGRGGEWKAAGGKNGDGGGGGVHATGGGVGVGV